MAPASRALPLPRVPGARGAGTPSSHRGGFPASSSGLCAATQTLFGASQGACDPCWLRGCRGRREGRVPATRVRVTRGWEDGEGPGCPAKGEDADPMRPRPRSPPTFRVRLSSAPLRPTPFSEAREGRYVPVRTEGSQRGLPSFPWLRRDAWVGAGRTTEPPWTEVPAHTGVF